MGPKCEMHEQQLEKEVREEGEGAKAGGFSAWGNWGLGQGEALHGALGLPLLPHLGPPGQARRGDARLVSNPTMEK